MWSLSLKSAKGRVLVYHKLLEDLSGGLVREDWQHVLLKVRFRVGPGHVLYILFTVLEIFSLLYCIKKGCVESGQIYSTSHHKLRSY